MRGSSQPRDHVRGLLVVRFAKSSCVRGLLGFHLCPYRRCHQVGSKLMAAGASRELLVSRGHDIACEECSSMHANSEYIYIVYIIYRENIVYGREISEPGSFGVDWCTGTTDSEVLPTSSLRALSEGGCSFLCTLSVDTPYVDIYMYNRLCRYLSPEPFGLQSIRSSRLQLCIAYRPENPTDR